VTHSLATDPGSLGLGLTLGWFGSGGTLLIALVTAVVAWRGKVPRSVPMIFAVMGTAQLANTLARHVERPSLVLAVLALAVQLGGAGALGYLGLQELRRRRAAGSAEGSGSALTATPTSEP